MVMGSVRGAGAGCVCPENAVLKALMGNLILSEREVVILDMVAGLEHLGRGTAGAVDVMIVVVEPGLRSLDIGRAIIGLAEDLGVPRIEVVANKVRHAEDLNLIRMELDGRDVSGYLPFSIGAIEADMHGEALYDVAPDLVANVREIVEQLNMSGRDR